MWEGVFTKLPLNSFGFPNDTPELISKHQLIIELKKMKITEKQIVDGIYNNAIDTIILKINEIFHPKG